MNLRCGLMTIGAFLLSACASDPPAEAPAAVVTAPTVIEKPATATKVVVVEKPPPPAKVVSGEKPAASAKTATGSVPKAANQCKGAPQLACINIAGCEWIKRTSPTDKDGRPLIDYCRLKTTASAAR
jgi:hypothetical protein